jgi:hypothetical protein
MQISPEEEDGVDDRKFISIICICADKIGKTLIVFYLRSLITSYCRAVILVRIIYLDHHYVGFRFDVGKMQIIHSFFEISDKTQKLCC